jgi:hypothetical protein
MFVAYFTPRVGEMQTTTVISLSWFSPVFCVHACVYVNVRACVRAYEHKSIRVCGSLCEQPHRAAAPVLLLLSSAQPVHVCVDRPVHDLAGRCGLASDAGVSLGQLVAQPRGGSDPVGTLGCLPDGGRAALCTPSLDKVLAWIRR